MARRGVFREMILKWKTRVSMHANASLEQLSVLTNKPLHHINDNFSRRTQRKLHHMLGHLKPFAADDPSFERFE